MIQVYRNGQNFFTIEDLCEGSVMSRQLMENHYIKLKFSTENPVYFEIGDSVEIPDFGLFVLTSAYFPKYNSTTDGYDYEMQMDAYYMAWKNKICKYRPQHGANETSFKLTAHVSAHLNVVLSNLKALGYKYNGKDIVVDYTTYNKSVFDVEKRFLVEYNSISIIEALNTIAESLKCEWWIDGSVIYLGYCEMTGQTVFEQGVNMLSMSQSDSKSDYITRLYAFGSDKNIPSGYFTGAEKDVTTDGVATDYLMLPNKKEDSEGFYSKDGYIENTNVVKNDGQAIEGVVVFDDEYPKVSCTISNIKTYDKTAKNNDGTTTTETFWQVTSTDSFATSFKQSWIKHNLTLMIKFESGALIGMEFEISFKILDGVNYFEVVANDNYGRKLPDTTLCPKVNDKFFLYNWDATKITETNLIQDAREALFERAKTYYKKSMIDNSNFTCVMDGEKFYNNGTYDYQPLGEQVKLINPMFADTDANGKHYRNSRIIGMEIKLDIPYDSPTYIIGEKASYSRLGQLEDKVESITVSGKQVADANGGSGVYVIGENDVTPETDSNVYSARRTRNNFLSKTEDDIAQGIIRFVKGLKFGAKAVDNPLGISSDGIATLKEIVSAAFRSGALGSGFKLGIYSDSEDSYLEVDHLLVRKAAEFVKLVIRELQSVGGEIVLSPAAMKISNVVYFEKGVYLPEYEELPLRYNIYRCYFLQKKGDEEIENQFVEGDLVRCQTFNVKKGVNGNVKNRYYWRKVYKVGKDFIDVLADFGDTGSDVPQAGDELVQMGNVYDTDRQSVVVLSAYGADAPSLKMYEGVDSYSLENKEVFVLSRKEMFSIADKFRFITRNANGEIKSTQSFAELVISVDGLKSTVDANKEAVDGQITHVYSQISQTATQISLKVGSALTERRNLLTGSAFRKQGEGCDHLRSKIYCTSAHEGANVIFAPDAKTGGARWGEAANSRNIHVTKGKTYTLTFWARTKSAKVEITGEVVWHSSATDTSRPSGYTGPKGSANLGGVTITPSNGWYLYQKTFTVAANAPYEWISVACVKVDASTASQQVYIAHPILIEGTAEDFVCWSASPNDYNYIGGNLLDDTRTFAKTGNLMSLDASVVTNESYNNGCSVIYANAASKYIEMAQWNVSSIIKKGEDYMFSFMAKGSGGIDAYMWSGSNLSIFAEDSERDTTTSNADGGRRFYLTSEWKRYWVHWRSEGTGIPNYVLIRCIQGGKAWVTMPKLEVGATPTDWIDSANGYVEDSGIAAKLLRTGIDIEQDKIIFTSDNAVFRDNSGQEVAAFKDGAINADLVKVTQMETKAEGGATIKIHNGLLEVIGTIGKTNIRFGVNENGMAVMQYLDNAGNTLYDLGPNGWDASRFSEAVVTRIGVMPATEWLGTTNFTETKTYEVGSYSVKLPVATARAGRIIFGALDEIEQEGVLDETSVPNSYKNFYQYIAARNNGKCMPDEDRGLTTEALAQQADGKYFTSDMILAENGSLKNLANGVYFFVGYKTEKTEAPSTGGKYPDRRLSYSTFSNGKARSSWVYSRTWRKV